MKPLDIRFSSHRKIRPMSPLDFWMTCDCYKHSRASMDKFQAAARAQIKAERKRDARAYAILTFALALTAAGSLALIWSY